MTWVKVCGLTRPGDVAIAVDAGADAVGFVSFAGSPRHVAIDTIAGLAADLPVTTVLLTVGLDVDRALAAAMAAAVDAIQPYGPQATATATAAVAAGFTVLLPSEPGSSAATRGVTPLYDTPHDTLHGGTGRTFDWEQLRPVEGRFVLAGGLGPDNVAAAIAAVRPWGVDASSRLEAAPGVKDPGKVIAFVEEARRA
jgi:phosphoribosylanthranilate isomerase